MQIEMTVIRPVNDEDIEMDVTVEVQDGAVVEAYVANTSVEIDLSTAESDKAVELAMAEQESREQEYFEDV